MYLQAIIWSFTILIAFKVRAISLDSDRRSHLSCRAAGYITVICTGYSFFAGFSFVTEFSIFIDRCFSQVGGTWNAIVPSFCIIARAIDYTVCPITSRICGTAGGHMSQDKSFVFIRVIMRQWVKIKLNHMVSLIQPNNPDSGMHVLLIIQPKREIMQKLNLFI